MSFTGNIIITAAMSADCFKKAMTIRGIPKEALRPMYVCTYVITPEDIIIVHPDLETIQN